MALTKRHWKENSGPLDKSDHLVSNSDSGWVPLRIFNIQVIKLLTQLAVTAIIDAE